MRALTRDTARSLWDTSRWEKRRGIDLEVVQEGAARSGADLAMERYAAGDGGAFGEVYDAVAPRLLAYLQRRSRSAAQAEDLLQQTLLHVHRARGTFLPGAEVMPWCFAIVRRLLVDASRRARRDAGGLSGGLLEPPEVPAGDATGEQVAEARELLSRAESALAEMPALHREAFELVRRDGLSMREAAQVLGTTVTAVKLRAHRAYQALRLALGGRK